MQEQSSQPILIRVAEAARLLDVSRALIYDLANRGLLPVVRLGDSGRGPMRVHRPKLLAMLDEATSHDER